MNRVGLQSTHMLPKLFRPQPRAGAVTFLDGYSITRKFNGVAGTTPKIPAWQLGHVAALRRGLHGSVLCRPPTGRDRAQEARARPGHAAFRLFGHRNGRRHFAGNNDRRCRRRFAYRPKKLLGLGTLGRRATSATGAAEQQNTSKTLWC